MFFCSQVSLGVLRGSWHSPVITGVPDAESLSRPRIALRGISQSLSNCKQQPHSHDSAEAPNINFAKEVYDLNLMANTIRAIFLVPRILRPGQRRMQ